MLLLPGLSPFGYADSFFALMLAADAVVAGLLARATRHGGSPDGVWLWVVAVPLLGPTVLARYDLAVTAPTVAALLLMGSRRADRHRVAGFLAGAAAAMKAWPVLVFVGVPGRRRIGLLYAWVALGAAVVVFGLAAALPGAFSFLRFQRARGIEVESVFALPFHVASWGRWSGLVRESHGSLEFHGPYIDAVGRLSLFASALGFAWLLLWRVTARRFTGATPFDAALTALLIFVVTSRVISPQYLVWLIGLAAVCVLRRDTTQRPPALLILLATPLTLLEFPVWFGELIASRPQAVLVLGLRNGLLVAALVLSARGLWRAGRALSLPVQAFPVPRERDPLGSRGV